MPTTIINAQSGEVVALSAALASPSTFRTFEAKTGAALLLSAFIAQPTTLQLLDVSTGRTVTYANSGSDFLRIEWGADANTLYVVQKDGTGGKVTQISRGIGAAADGTNVGAPYLRMRPIKEGTLAVYANPVAANVVWQNNEIGAMDYVGRSAANKFYGSFHGDGPNGVLNSPEIITVDGVPVTYPNAASGGSFLVRNDTTSSDGTVSLRTDISYAFGPSGMTMTLNDTQWTGITLAYYGMPIGSGTGMIEVFPSYGGVQVPGAILFDAAQEGVAYWGPASAIRVRNPTTGGFVMASGNMVGRTGYVEARTDKELATSRTKSYLSAWTAATGLPGSVVTFTWGLTTPGASTVQPNILSDSTFASPPWSRVSNNGTSADSAGDLTLTWTTGTSNTREHLATGTATGTRYFGAVDLISATGAGTREFYIGSNSNGSNTSPLPAATTSTYQTLMPVGRTILAFVGTVDAPEQRFGVRAAATAAATSVWRSPRLMAAA